MTIFTKWPQPAVKPYSYKEYILVEDYHFKYHLNNYVIPAGFIWDGMSIPKPFWSVVGSPFCAQHLVAGLVHDYGYRTGWLPKRTIDIMMKDILRDHGESRLNIQRMYLAVRLFGGKHYKGK